MPVTAGERRCLRMANIVSRLDNWPGLVKQEGNQGSSKSGIIAPAPVGSAGAQCRLTSVQILIFFWQMPRRL